MDLAWGCRVVHLTGGHVRDGAARVGGEACLWEGRCRWVPDPCPSYASPQVQRLLDDMQLALCPQGAASPTVLMRRGGRARRYEERDPVWRGRADGGEGFRGEGSTLIPKPAAAAFSAYNPSFAWCLWPRHGPRGLGGRGRGELHDDPWIRELIQCTFYTSARRASLATYMVPGAVAASAPGGSLGLMDKP